MTSATSSQSRALDLSWVPAPVASARYQLPFLGSTIWNLKVLAAARMAAALTLHDVRWVYLTDQSFTYLSAKQAPRTMDLTSMLGSSFFPKLQLDWNHIDDVEWELVRL